MLRETNCAERHDREGPGRDARAICAPLRRGVLGAARAGAPPSSASAWPGLGPGLTVEDKIDIAVQVNGKTAAKVRVPRGAEEAAIAAAALQGRGGEALHQGKELRKQIYVPGRLLNLVVG